MLGNVGVVDLAGTASSNTPKIHPILSNKPINMLLPKLLILISFLTVPEDVSVEQRALNFVVATILEPRSEEFEKISFHQMTNGKRSGFQFFSNCFFPHRDELYKSAQQLIDDNGTDTLIPKKLNFPKSKLKIRRNARKKIIVWNSLLVDTQRLVRIDVWVGKQNHESYFLLFSESGTYIDHCVDGAVY